MAVADSDTVSYGVQTVLCECNNLNEVCPRGGRLKNGCNLDTERHPYATGMAIAYSTTVLFGVQTVLCYCKSFNEVCP